MATKKKTTKKKSNVQTLESIDFTKIMSCDNCQNFHGCEIRLSASRANVENIDHLAIADDCVSFKNACGEDINGDDFPIPGTPRLDRLTATGKMR